MPRGKSNKQHSIAQLQGMIREQRGRRSKLMTERRKAQKKLDAIDHQIAQLDGEANGTLPPGGKRPRNDKPLPDVIESVLKKNGGKPMRVGDIAEAVQGTGYSSSSANFKGIVNQALIKDDRFTSASRGHYQMA